MSVKESERCSVTIEFGDDFGDNVCTFRCGLKKGHRGRHVEKGDMGYGVQDLPYTVTWKAKT